MKSIILWTTSILVCIALIGLLQSKIEAIEDDRDTQNLLFVPDIRVLHGLMLGDDAVAADLLWLRSVFYIASYHDHGSHESTVIRTQHDHVHSDHADIETPEFADIDLSQSAGVIDLLFSKEDTTKAVHLYKLLNMVTDLDSAFATPYFEGALNLGLAFGRYDQALELLKKGIINVPASWEMFYYSGFIKLFYLNDKNGAADDMMQAAMIPNAPPIVVQQAAAIKVGLGQSEMVIEFLKTLYITTENNEMKEKIEDMLAVYELGMPKAPIIKNDISESLDSLLKSL